MHRSFSRMLNQDYKTKNLCAFRINNLELCILDCLFHNYVFIISGQFISAHFFFLSIQDLPIRIITRSEKKGTYLKQLLGCQATKGDLCGGGNKCEPRKMSNNGGRDF